MIRALQGRRRPSIHSFVRVTVFVLTRDRLAYLTEAVGSVLAQSLREIQVVILDNAGTEDVSSAMARFNDPRISVIRHPRNIGSIENMNAALALAETPYVVIFHDDDTMRPELLQTQLSILDRQRELVFIGTGYRNVTEPAEMARFPPHGSTQLDIFPDQRSLLRFLISEGTLNFASAMYRRTAVARHRLDVARYGRFADRPFIVEVSEEGPSAYLRGEWVNYRLHRGQQSNVGPLTEDQVRAMLRYYRSILEPGWSRSTRRFFYGYSTNVLLDTYATLPRERRPPLVSVVTRGLRDQVLHPLFIRRAGAVALVRAATAALLPKASRGSETFKPDPDQTAKGPNATL